MLKKVPHPFFRMLIAVIVIIVGLVLAEVGSGNHQNYFLENTGWYITIVGFITLFLSV